MPEGFGAYLRGELAARNWTYSDLAARSGLHVSLVSRVARGQRRPTPAFLRQCAAALGVPLAELMARSGRLEDAVAALGSAEAAALRPYMQYAATPEGQEEIATRLPEKVARVQHLADRSGKLAALLERVGLLAERFRSSHGAGRALIGGALLYFLSPVDMVPDFIPVTGFLDDLSVLALAVGLVTGGTAGGDGR